MSGVTTLIGDLKMGTEKEMGTKLKKGRCPFLDTFHFPSILHGLQINLLIFPRGLFKPPLKYHHLFFWLGSGGGSPPPNFEKN